MRPSRPLATALFVASLAVAGCSTHPAPTTAAVTAPPATTTVPRTTTAMPPSAPTTIQAPTPAAACAPLPWPGWGTGLQQRPSSSSAPVYLVRAGRQECSDRVVFHLNGPDPVGYSVRYVDLVREDGSGRPVPVAGGAALQVVINAPALGQDSHGYVGKVLAEPRADFYTPAQLAGWSSLRQVRYAGSFEGQTTIAVGVRARFPFRAFTVLDRGGNYRSLVLDIAPDL
jgi:hypothetical protein